MDYNNIDEVIDTIKEKCYVDHDIKGAVKMVEDAPEGLRNDKNFFRKLRMRLEFGFSNFCKCIGEELSNDEDFILEMAQGEGNNLSCASEQLRGKREFMERACTILDPRYVVANASPELKGSKDFILMALDNTDEGWLITSADEKLFDDEDIRKVISEKYDGQRVITRMEQIKAENKQKSTISEETSLKKTVKEMSEEELTEMWTTDPEYLRVLLSDSELTSEEMADLFVDHPILQYYILEISDADELLGIIQKRLQETSFEYNLTPFWADEELKPSKKAFEEEIKKYEKAISEIETSGRLAEDVMIGYDDEAEISFRLEKEIGYKKELEEELGYVQAQIDEMEASMSRTGSSGFEPEYENYNSLHSQAQMLKEKIERVTKDIEFYQALDNLGKKESELSGLEAEEKTISEAEALIDKQAEKTGEQK